MPLPYSCWHFYNKRPFRTFFSFFFVPLYKKKPLPPPKKKKENQTESLGFSLAVSLGRGRKILDVSVQPICNLAISASVADPLQPFQEQAAFCEVVQSTEFVSDKHVTKKIKKIKISEWHLKPRKETLNEGGKFTRILL